jgi:ribosome-associated toxin RatA of RatAB toxin-antitoxin module
VLYGLVADAMVAPLVFPATVHVAYLDRTESTEHIRIWAADDDDNLRCWTSRRRHDPALRTVAFQADEPWPPLLLMRGEWRFEPLSADRTLVTLAHAYAADTDDLGGLEGLLDRVSTGQLAALERFQHHSRFSFEDNAELACAAADAHVVVRAAAEWPSLVPAIERARLANSRDGADLFHVTATGPHETRLVLVAPSGQSSILFKDLRPAPPLAAHSSRWRIEPTDTGCRVSVRHDVAVESTSDTPVDEALVRRLAAATMPSLSQLIAACR